MLDQPSMAVLIDCWKYPRSIHWPWFLSQRKKSLLAHHNRCVANIVDFCRLNENIQSVALTTRGPFSEISREAHNTSWLTVGKQLLHDEVGKLNYFLRVPWQNKTMSWLCHTHPLITHMTLRDDQIGFAVFDCVQLLYYCNYVNPGIRNIWICGFTWDLCVKYNRIGWLELSGLVNANMFRNAPNILINLDCVGGVADQPDFVPDPVLWHPVKDRIYQLDIAAAQLL